MNEADKQYLSAILEYMRPRVPADKTLLYSGGKVGEAEEYGTDDGSVLYPGTVDAYRNGEGIKPPKGSTYRIESLESAAFALVSSGKVRVMMPKEGLYEKRDFTEFEWPNLMPPTNTAVTEIVWVDPDDFLAAEKILWKPSSNWRTFPLNTPVSNINP
jgi:hypothetical protein